MDWERLDDITGKFSEDFFATGRNQPLLPPDRNMGWAFGGKSLGLR